MRVPMDSDAAFHTILQHPGNAGRCQLFSPMSFFCGYIQFHFFVYAQERGGSRYNLAAIIDNSAGAFRLKSGEAGIILPVRKWMLFKRMLKEEGEESAKNQRTWIQKS